MVKPQLSLQNINKYYGDLHVLKNLSLDIYEGEFLTLLGPSGCGKTTILRCIAGFEEVNSGDIRLNDSSIINLPANKRKVNTVFQNYALFPHLSVYENIAYGPKVTKSIEGEELNQKINDVLKLVKMEGYDERSPDQLSGGQMQRIAIARALINNPDILLLDEPLGALDLKLRKHMQYELSNIQKETKTTFIYVTHDQDEALNMSDRLVVIEDGEIEQIGTPKEIYNFPKNIFVAGFVGERNIVKVKALEQHGDHSLSVEIGGKSIDVKCSLDDCPSFKKDMEVMLAIHADKMHIETKETKNSFSGVVKSLHYAGSQIRTEIEVDGNILRVIEYFSNDSEYFVGDTVYITWHQYGAVLLPIEKNTKKEDLD